MATTDVVQATSPDRRQTEPGESRGWLIVLFVVLGSLMTYLLAIAETGPGKLRDPKPIGTHVVDGYPRANPPVLGFEYWPQLWQAIGFAGGGILLIIFGVKSWRARRMHNGLCVTLAAGGMMAFDPFYNWLGYFPTDPRFLHIPHGTTPWSDLAPTFEPVFFWPLYMIWLTGPALLAHWVWAKWRARAYRLKGEQSWMHRHPLLSLLLVCKLVTFPIDWGGFRLGALTEAFIFSQAPGPMLAGGNTTQMQLVWEPILFPLTIMATSLLFYRDDDGQTLHGKAARKLRTYAWFPRLTECAVAWSIIAVAYVVCLGGMASLRFTGQSDELARPWPYQDTQVYDPDGLYRQAGEPGLTRPGSGNFDFIRPELPR